MSVQVPFPSAPMFGSVPSGDADRTSDFENGPV
jgi:hypothetical protein